jgi:hypothetical protein
METMSNQPHDRLDFTYDFGDDADGTPSSDPAFDAWLRRSAPALNAPGHVPAEDMWSAIAAASRNSTVASTVASAVGSAERNGGVLPMRPRRWMRPTALAAALAATLVLGVALDRLVILRSGDTSATASVARTTTPSTSRPTPSEASNDLYRLAAVQTLSQAEALLTAYRASDGSTRDSITTRHLGRWAREVLGSTRLLIDSPAGSDPQIRVLLDDIELVLVQIVRLSGTPLDSTDRALIDNALRDRDLLPRIRTAVPAGAADVGTASDD